MDAWDVRDVEGGWVEQPIWARIVVKLVRKVSSVERLEDMAARTRFRDSSSVIGERRSARVVSTIKAMEGDGSFPSFADGVVLKGERVR